MTRQNIAADPHRAAPIAPAIGRPDRPARTSGRLAALLVSTALIAPAQAATPSVFSPAWFAARTSGRAAAGTAAALAARSGASLGQVQQSIANLQRAAQAIAAATAAQNAARAAAFALPATVPDGLVPGGLQTLPGVQPGQSTWLGANLPTQSLAGQHATVTVQQTAKQAVLTWQSFNVGRNTTLVFDQSAGGAAANTWVALNRVSDPYARPSQILGSITAPGQVYVINANGVIFGATAQVNTGALIASAADIDDATFLNNGIYSTIKPGGTISPTGIVVPSFRGATGAITVQAGAQITTNTPQSANIGGGFVLLMGSTVANAGVIATQSGQAVLAAGRDFGVVAGFGSSTNADKNATVQGNQVVVSQAGPVENTGLIQASDGDVTMAGHAINQAGVIIASTGLGQRGTVHLLTDYSDSTASVTLDPGSVTAITIDTSSATALEALRSSTPTPIVPASLEIDSYAGLADIRDLSRVEITSGGSVGFGAGSLALATSGQIAIAAKGNVLMAPGASADVGGLVGVSLPQSANVFQVTVEPYNLRDSPDNRDTTLLSNQTVSIDARTLQYVPAENGSAARYYTGGGLLEVSGELGNVGHTIAEYSTTGGTVEIQAPTLITQPGSGINLAGGSIQYQAGPVAQTWLLGADGRLYNLDTATDNVVYTGVFNGFTETHPHWGVSQTFINPLIAPATIEEQAYTVGHDAGALTLATSTGLLGGTIQAGTAIGARQNTVAVSGETGLLVTQTVVPQGGTLSINGFGIGEAQTGAADILFADATPATDGLSLRGRLPKPEQDRIVLSAPALDAAGLGTILAQTSRTIAVAGALSVADGGSIDLLAPVVLVTAPLVARGGAVTLGEIASTSNPTVAPDVHRPGVALGSGASIDTRGVWTNALQQPDAISTEAWINGGAVTLQSTGFVTLAPGSGIDASAGGYVGSTGKITGGAGGNIALLADAAPKTTTASYPLDTPGPSNTRALTLDGTVRSVGFTHGGTLSLQAPGIAIGDGLQPGYAGELVLSPSLFASGFANYIITSATDVRVAPGAQVTVVEPVYQATTLTAYVPGGSDPDAAFQVVLPPLYLPNPVQARLTQRVGASLTLDAPGETATTIPDPNTNDVPLQGPANPYGKITLGAGALIGVDPGRSAVLDATLSAEIDGAVTAPGGTIEVLVADLVTSNQALGSAALSIGPAARLDVAGVAVTALSDRNQAYGIVTPGGSIVLGNVSGTNAGGQLKATDAYIIVHPGAVLDASGTSAAIDPGAGLFDATQAAGATAVEQTAGGTISLASYTGIVVGGTLRAASGGSSAAGGVLDVILESGVYSTQGTTLTPLEDLYFVPRILTIDQSVAAPTQDASTVTLERSGIGVATLSADAITAGGFGTVSLFARDGIVFNGDVNLALPQALALRAGALGNLSARGDVTLSAPYVLLAGAGLPLNTDNGAAGQQPYAEIPGTLNARGSLIVSANLIDLQNAVLIGASLTATRNHSNGAVPTQDVSGFATLNLVSSGDIRLLPGVSPLFASATALVSPQDISLSAAQIYPTTGAVAEVDAGLFYINASPTSVYSDPESKSHLTISAVPGLTPAPPLSAFGKLTLNAPTIEQGGIVRAPFGVIQVGASVGIAKFLTKTTPASVTFLPGSITSVSAAGLTIPYGGTSDGVTYSYAGGTATFNYLTGGSNGPTYGISVAGQAIDVEAGASLDLRGGGTLSGAGFLSGRGGSTDTLLAPLPGVFGTTFSAPALGASDAVYALLPGTGYTPPSQPDPTGATGSVPGIGQTVTIGAGVAGLPAGTYTLLPSYYALLPGGYRIELRSSIAAPPTGTQALPDGSFLTPVQTGIANTAVLSAVPVSALVTPGATVRHYSQYNEKDYATFAATQASVSVFGNVAATVPADAGELDLVFGPNRPRTPAFVNQGSELLTPASGGLGGTLVVVPDNASDTLTIGAAHTQAPGSMVVDAAALDAVAPASMIIGGIAVPGSTPPPTSVQIEGENSGLTLAPGAVLVATQVVLLSRDNVSVSHDATVDTLGQSASVLNLDPNVAFGSTATGSVVISSTNRNGNATLGTGSIALSAGATVYAAGSLSLLTNGPITLSPLANLGASSLRVTATDINIGDPSDIHAANAPAGLLLSQQLLDALLAGNPALGVPALQELDLTASKSVNFYGSTQLNGSALRLFVLNTPGIYGAGADGDVAVLNVGTLYWNGDDTISGAAVNAAGQVTPSTATIDPPPLVTPGGPGSGSGTLQINAQEVVFGFGPNDPAYSFTPEPRGIFGFATVDIAATQQVVAANLGTLLVYQSQGTVQPNGTLSGTGGVLNIATPLLTAAAAGTLDVTVGGALTLAPGLGVTPSTATPDAAGGELGFAASSIDDSTAIVLPSGRALLTAQSDIALEPGARLDVSGENHAVFDQTISGPGGTAILSSASGSVTALAGSAIAFTGAGNQPGGTLQVGAAQGTAALSGTLQGGGVDAADSGAFTLDAGVLPSFASLNQALTAGGVFGTRHFEIGSGDLTIQTTDELRARTISVSVDAGSLTVNGLVDASGARVGTIALAGQTGLTLTGQATLAASGSVLVADSYGQPIDASNRAEISLTAAAGTLTLAPGATIALDAADGVARGDLELDAPRATATGGVIEASAPGTLDVTGAATIALNGFWTYRPADGRIVQSNIGSGGTLLDANAIGLDQINPDSVAFETAALALLGKAGTLAGLTGYGSAFHLRPGVAIVGAAGSLNAGGTLQVDGDLDLSGFRYGPGAKGNGAGEPGVLLLRAAGDLSVFGSISDGFVPPPATPDQAGWTLFANGGPIVDATPVLTTVTLAAGTQFNNADMTLAYAINLRAGARLKANAPAPMSVTLAADTGPLPRAWVTTAAIVLGSAPGGPPAGTILPAGTTLPAGTILPQGSVLAAGSTLPEPFRIAAATVPAGSDLAVFAAPVTLASTVLQSGDVIPGGATVVLANNAKSVPTRPASGSAGAQGSIDALAAMLPAGSLSWSIDLVAGANLAAADPVAVQPAAQVAGPGGAAATGNLLLDDPHFGVETTAKPGPQGFSVVRTGTGALDLAAAGSIDPQSPFGVYTAGTQSSGVASTDEPAAISPLGVQSPAYQAVIASQLRQGYQPYYPVDGGNLGITAQGSISDIGTATGDQPSGTKGWLWEQGSASQLASWWINFGTYVESPKGVGRTPAIAGFTGYGTLGGGNLQVQSGGDEGATSDPLVPGADGLTLAVGSTGRVTSVAQTGTIVTGGALVQSGGGDLGLQVGGALLGQSAPGVTQPNPSIITDTRGQATISAGSVGIVDPAYAAATGDPRFLPPTTAEAAFVDQGVTLAIGDGTGAVTARGDIEVLDAIDPGRQGNNFLFSAAGTGGAEAAASPSTGFSLWQPGTGITLLSTGGNVGLQNSSNTTQSATILPPALSVSAQHGSLFVANYLNSGTQAAPIELAPSSQGGLSLLAADSIYGPALIGMSGAPADVNDLANPFRPTLGPNLILGDDTPTAPIAAPGAQPIRVYAGSGDIVDLTVGFETVSTKGATLYVGSLPTSVIAGQDIVNVGQAAGEFGFLPVVPGLFVNDSATDVSVLQAGRDIIYANLDVAGPGLLYVQAGRDLYQGVTYQTGSASAQHQETIASLGQQVVNQNIPASDVSSGASITVLVGTGASGPDWTAFDALYLDDANQANPNLLISDPANAGKVQQTYGSELLAWLQQTVGYTGDQDGALAAFLALPVPLQSEFTLPIYFDELRLSGRQFTDPTSRFYKSYTRGKQAIATLFPGTYSGSLTMFGLPFVPATTNSGTIDSVASAITTNFGGNITVLAPGGGVTLGTPLPGQFPSTYGLITFGQGDIDIYSQGSVLLGTSRIFTTFGGGITAWSAQGDINAGAGTKSAVVAQPFTLAYDQTGDITLSPQAPSTGAGIATLNEIPGTVPGDVDLIAPQGTIDAGEAGIRSSGNANLAAAAIANGSNIQSQGKTTGTAVIATPNIGALSAAASVGSAATNTATQTASKQPTGGADSIITVDVLGFGG